MQSLMWDPRKVTDQEAKSVEKALFGTKKLKELTEDMIAIMRKAPGVGLAAPQIGLGLKVNSLCLRTCKMCNPCLHFT